MRARKRHAPLVAVARTPARSTPGAASAMPTMKRRCTLSCPAASAMGAGARSSGACSVRTVAASARAREQARQVGEVDRLCRYQRVCERERLVAGERAVLAQNRGEPAVSESTPGSVAVAPAPSADPATMTTRQREHRRLQSRRPSAALRHRPARATGDDRSRRRARSRTSPQAPRRRRAAAPRERSAARRRTVGVLARGGFEAARASACIRAAPGGAAAAQARGSSGSCIDCG